MTCTSATRARDRLKRASWTTTGWKTAEAAGRGHSSGSLYSAGSGWAMPLWQSMQVLPACLAAVCLAYEDGFCLSELIASKEWQLRQVAESVAFIRSHWC